jgi:hypothetical protein
MMNQFVIYKSPRDAPGKWVVRRWEIGPGTVEGKDGWVCASLEQARALVPGGMALTARTPDDDPSIYEVWL